MSEYESPVKQQLREGLAKLGNLAPPAFRQSVQKAIAGIDDTDPAPVARKLPPQVLAFYEACALRGQDLARHCLRARDQGFHIETIVVSHGLIQHALRGLYVLAWQRTREQPLTEEELRPLFDHKDRRVNVPKLVPVLVESGLLYDTQGETLNTANAIRNKVAHGVVTGEISMERIAEQSHKVHWAAVGALDRMNGWFSNPRPLIRILNFSATPTDRRGTP
jgi:hypothetical protein